VRLAGGSSAVRPVCETDMRGSRPWLSDRSRRLAPLVSVLRPLGWVRRGLAVARCRSLLSLLQPAHSRVAALPVHLERMRYAPPGACVAPDGQGHAEEANDHRTDLAVIAGASTKTRIATTKLVSAPITILMVLTPRPPTWPASIAPARP
jgi:hypothetical protein